MQGLMSTKEVKQSASRSGRRRQTIIAGAITILGMGLIISCVSGFMQKPAQPRAAQAAEQAPVATVTTYTVTPVPIKTQVTASGTVAARHTLDIGPEISGLKVVQVNVEEGDRVKKGQILARLSDDILQAQLSREQANLNGAMANLAKTKQPNRAEDIAGLRAAFEQALAGVTQAKANVTRAQTNLKNLRTISSRYEKLKSEGAISVQDALDKQTAASMADDDLAALNQQVVAAQFVAKQAEEKLKAAESGGRDVDISISAANVGQLQASVRQMQAQVNQTILRAPTDGIVTKRTADIGEITSMAQPMFSIACNEELELRAQVQEIDLPAIRSGASVKIVPASAELHPFTATVRELSPVVDSHTRLGVAYINIPASAGLKEGMYANSAIATGEHNAIAVPTRAVRAEDDDKFVFVLKGKTALRRPVTVGTTNSDMVEIVSGLSAGEKLILDGAGFLKDGDAVSINNNSLVPVNK